MARVSNAAQHLVILPLERIYFPNISTPKLFLLEEEGGESCRNNFRINAY
jgi:hypothetical protein